ncbi:unnamed protein product [Mortierella alpina]
MDPGFYLILKETNNGSNISRESNKRHKSKKSPKNIIAAQLYQPDVRHKYSQENMQGTHTSFTKKKSFTFKADQGENGGLLVITPQKNNTLSPLYSLFSISVLYAFVFVAVS